MVNLNSSWKEKALTRAIKLAPSSTRWKMSLNILRFSEACVESMRSSIKSRRWTGKFGRIGGNKQKPNTSNCWCRKPRCYKKTKNTSRRPPWWPREFRNARPEFQECLRSVDCYRWSKKFRKITWNRLSTLAHHLFSYRIGSNLSSCPTYREKCTVFLIRSSNSCTAIPISARNCKSSSGAIKLWTWTSRQASLRAWRRLDSGGKTKSNISWSNSSSKFYSILTQTKLNASLSWSLFSCCGEKVYWSCPPELSKIKLILRKRRWSSLNWKWNTNKSRNN